MFEDYDVTEEEMRDELCGLVIDRVHRSPDEDLIEVAATLSLDRTVEYIRYWLFLHEREFVILMPNKLSTLGQTLRQVRTTRTWGNWHRSEGQPSGPHLEAQDGAAVSGILEQVNNDVWNIAIWGSAMDPGLAFTPDKVDRIGIFKRDWKRATEYFCVYMKEPTEVK